MTKKFLMITLLAVSVFLIGVNIASAEAGDKFRIVIDAETIAKGYTVTAFNDSLKLSLVPGILDEATPVEIENIKEDLIMPWDLDRISNIYQFEFKNKAAYDNHKPFYIQFSYNKESNGHKTVHFFDKNFNAWRPLPTRDYPKDGFVRSLIHLPYARLAVFSDPYVMDIGEASWYGYKGGYYAASPDYPKGSKLRVYNLDSEDNRYVDVIVNDYGPERKLFPNRAIDLDKVAFDAISPLGEGIINVSIEPLYIPGVIDDLKKENVEVSALSAIIIRESDNKILFEKNANQVVPIASLTKLISTRTFLDTEPSLNDIVAYSDKDLENNYRYASVYDGIAKLRQIDDGETLTIEDLVYTSLVGSANNTVETLVRNSGMSRDEFVAKMNQNVLDWGVKSTHFIEPTGLSEQNVSSAKDYAIISKEVFKSPVISKASSTPRYKFSTISDNTYHSISNTNRLIPTDKYNIIGSKTGFLNESKYCLTTKVEAGDDNIIVVLLGADTRSISFEETEELIKYGLRKVIK